MSERNQVAGRAEFKVHPENKIVSPSDVVPILVDRLMSGSEPGKRHDGFRIALILEGGAMRSVISAGEVTGLSALDLIKAFDDIYAISAAGPVGAFVMAGQSHETLSNYWEETLNPAYVDRLRILRGKPVIDSSYTHDLIANKRPLDFDAFKKAQDSGINLHVYAADAASANLVEFTNFETREDLLDKLVVGMEIPYASSVHTPRDGRLVDASLVAGGLLLDQAIAGGATHIMTLLSGDREDLKRNRLYEALFTALLSIKFPDLAAANKKGFDKHNAALGKIRNSQNGGQEAASLDEIHIVNPKVGRTERRPRVVKAGAKAGYDATIEKFSGHNLKINPYRF